MKKGGGFELDKDLVAARTRKKPHKGAMDPFDPDQDTPDTVAVQKQNEYDVKEEDCLIFMTTNLGGESAFFLFFFFSFFLIACLF
jgi:hypothetical protein